MQSLLKSNFWLPPNWDITSKWTKWVRIAWSILAVGAFGLCFFLIAVIVNHLASPEITRGMTSYVVDRLLDGLPLYTVPSGSFVSITHVPFFYLLCAAFVKLFGMSAQILRAVAVIGTFGAWITVFSIVRRETNSAWFGLLAAGLFAGAYRAFDGYLDFANPDSWMLFSGLLGLYWLERSRTFKGKIFAVVLLCLSFWFKQHGAFLAVGGILYLIWREGPRKALPYLVIAGLLGPVAYLLLGPRLFGDQFFYFTYRVPSQWSVFNGDTIQRYLEYVAEYWMVLASVSGLALVYILWKRSKPNIWIFTLPFAVMIGFLGTLDTGSENNVYIVTGIWFIVVGTIALSDFLRPIAENKNITTDRLLSQMLRTILVIILVVLIFRQNTFNPIKEISPPEAWDAYNNFVQYMRGLQGIVYMPSAWYLPNDLRPQIVAPSVQLEDLVRGPGRNTSNNPLVESVLHELLNPPENAYIVTETPLGSSALLGFLAKDYNLIDDFGDKYKSLEPAPGRLSGNAWPRYVYAFKGNKPKQLTLVL